MTHFEIWRNGALIRTTSDADLAAMFEARGCRLFVVTTRSETERAA